MPKFFNYILEKPSRIFWLILGITLFIRFPFFFRDYVDQDESTFILMGQSWVDGNLPYTQLWDLKPPLVFLFFAGIIKVFGKSLLMIRLIGAFWVAACGFVTYLIGKKIYSKEVGLFSGIICVFLLSLFGSVQGLMSEHLALLPLLLAFYLVLKTKNIFSYFLIGLLFGITVMFRLNLAIAILIFCLYFCWVQLKEKTSNLLNLLVLGASIFIVPLIFYGIFASQNLQNLFIDSVFLAPLNYSDSSWKDSFSTLPVLLIFGLISYWIYSKKPDQNSRYLLVMNVGLLFMLFKSGKINGHYLMQIYPFVIPFLIFAIISLLKYYKVGKKFSYLVLLLLILIPIESYLEYKNIFQNYSEKQTLYNGEGYEVPKWITEKYGKQENIFFLNEHIGYWLMNAEPISKIATHPSNIIRETNYPFAQIENQNPEQELKAIFENKKPDFIIVDDKRNPLKKSNDLMEIFQTNISKNYHLDQQINRVKIYKINHL